MPLRVNGVEIDEAAVRYELDRLVRFYSGHMSESEVRAQMPLLRRKACEQAIGARLLIDEANELGIRAPSGEIDERLRETIRKAGGEKKFAAMLRGQKISREQVVAGIAQGLRVDKLVARLTANVAEPTEDDIRVHFEVHRREYRRPERAQAQHILIRPASAGEADRETARSRLEEIRARIAGGAGFADQAAAHSECASGRAAGGSLGWFSRGMTLPEIDSAVFSMAVGGVSAVIESPLGFHIVRKTGEEAGGDVALGDVRERIRDFLCHVRRGEAIAAHVAELKKSAVIEETD
ncbi:MAG: hypothetical protein FJ225_12330 [Lentisphaerae bacterium]|nr:hypothetical protein [Lentisphaerota bacterium]